MQSQAHNNARQHPLMQQLMRQKLLMIMIMMVIMIMMMIMMMMIMMMMMTVRIQLNSTRCLHGNSLNHPLTPLDPILW